eukprot:m.35232 g.35232  ORF g.35232 m.35232 type:complete len:165 (+) comp32090_c0_seq3:164-658(+)
MDKADLSREEKQRLRKKINRKRKRQVLAAENEDSAEEMDVKIYTVSKFSGKPEELERLQKDQADQAHQDEEPEPVVKKHRGLRCVKCFHLLCKDKDISFRNEELWLSRFALKDKHWHGLQIRQGKVFCQNMHKVGNIQRTSHANDTVYVPVLKVEKTTYRENFL